LLFPEPGPSSIFEAEVNDDREYSEESEDGEDGGDDEEGSETAEGWDDSLTAEMDSYSECAMTRP
jgi:hypothetical protein